MDFQSVIQTCRNVREFSPQRIPDEVLARILDSARVASSAFNFQPWRFVVVQDPETLNRLAECCKGQLFVGTAPAVLVCCGKRYHNRYTWLSDQLYLVDVAIAVDHLQLAARNEGIGSCWIAVFEPDPVKTLLEIPDDQDVVMLVPMGYPATEAVFEPAADRLALDQIAFSEKFGNQWVRAAAEEEAECERAGA